MLPPEDPLRECSPNLGSAGSWGAVPLTRDGQAPEESAISVLLAGVDWERRWPFDDSVDPTDSLFKSRDDRRELSPEEGPEENTDKIELRLESDCCRNDDGIL